MPSPARNWARWVVALAAVLVAALTPAPARADFLVTFTGTIEAADYFSIRFDGTDYFGDDVPPLFDLARLEGGSFRATFRVPDGPPADTDGTFADYEYDPPALASVVLLDPAGIVVHRLGVGLNGVRVEDERLAGRGGPPRGPPRPRPRVDTVGFSAAPTGLDGLNAPPELYGPNAFDEVFPSSIVLDFLTGERLGPAGPLSDLSIPADGDIYLAFDERYFSIGISVFNGDPDGNGPNLLVVTGLEGTVTGASVVPAAVPEPASVGLLAAGGLGLLGYARRRPSR